MHKVILVALAGVLVAGLTGCANPPRKIFPPPTDYVKRDDIRIEDQFVLVKLDAKNLGEEAVKCVSSAEAGSALLQKLATSLPLPPGRMTTFFHAGSASTFMVYRDSATCIRQSEDRYPILAAEAFRDTVTPKGPQPDVTVDWNRKIARKLALSGMVRVAYVMTNGNAFLANYWVEEELPRTTLRYSKAFRKAGEWENEAVDFRFSHPNIQSVEVVTRSEQHKRWNLIQNAVDR
ncbi:hypothetical protein [Hydrogenophaga sp.]|uniref:hypothetical protein n=1 Tax=Hydrogenophaga sp. TaxID=1904254 RepID=UPI00391B303C